MAAASPPFSSARRVLCPPPRPCLKAPPSRPAENPAGLWTMATIASFVGGIVSALALIFIAPMLARAAMSFGAPEYFAVAVFGLTVVASLSSGHLVKGLISALAGLFLATIGLDPVTGDMRNTFDNPNLFNGLSLVPVLVGLFAVSQVLVTVEDVVRGVSLKESTVSKRGISLKDLTGNVVNFIRSSVIGTLIGIIPATGVSAASFLAYSEAKRFSKTPEMYGKGCVEGIAATESSNNAVCGGALIPLLTLGVPGDIITAIMLGAAHDSGAHPRPRSCSWNIPLPYTASSPPSSSPIL